MRPVVVEVGVGALLCVDLARNPPPLTPTRVGLYDIFDLAKEDKAPSLKIIRLVYNGVGENCICKPHSSHSSLVADCSLSLLPAGTMMQATICQAMPVSRPASKVAPAPSGPLMRPHGFSQARRTVPFAFNPALDSFGDGMGVPMASFVRPDCPPDAEDVSAAPQKKEKRAKAAPQGGRPQFRSALEQVAVTSACQS